MQVAAPLTLDTSEPEPDLAVFEVEAPRPYHPGTAELVDLDGGRAVVHSEPGRDGYADVETIGPERELAAPQVGIAPIPLADVLAASRR